MIAGLPKEKHSSCFCLPDCKSGRCLATAHLTASSRETRWTQAVEAVNFVMATAAVEARPAGALVHVFLTVFTAEARSTLTFITVHQVLRGGEITCLLFIHYYRLMEHSVTSEIKSEEKSWWLTRAEDTQQHNNTTMLPTCSFLRLILDHLNIS